MKNLLKLLCVFVAASFLLASCKTASITKRHYNKGYYVSHAAKKGKLHPTAIEKGIEGSGAESLATKETKLPVTAPKDEEPVILTPSHQPVKRSEVAKAKTPVTNKRLEREQADNEITMQEPSLKEMVINPFKLAKVAAARDSGSDALSLIWVLIVVLLIIYIAGLLLDNFGLGGIIHILGVIILVLLVLWLLHLI